MGSKSKGGREVRKPKQDKKPKGATGTIASTVSAAPKKTT